MSGSDRGELTKAGLIGTVLVAIIGIAAYWSMFYSMGFQSGQNERKANVEAGHYANDTAKQIERECSAKAGQAARECIAKIVAAERESQRGESDLAAQWKAADWVMWAGVLAGAQLFATGLGLYFVRETLRATLKAVEDTGKATNAMVRQNEITTEKERAHLEFVHAEANADANFLSIILKFVNRGASLAEVYAISVGAYDSATWPRNMDLPSEGLQVKISPDSLGEVNHRCSMPVRMPCVVMGVILYKSVGRSDFKSHFAVILSEGLANYGKNIISANADDILPNDT